MREFLRNTIYWSILWLLATIMLYIMVTITGLNLDLPSYMTGIAIGILLETGMNLIDEFKNVR